MKSTRRTSVRRLASGSFIVSGVSSRSAVTGRFVNKSAGRSVNTANGKGVSPAASADKTTRPAGN